MPKRRIRIAYVAHGIAGTQSGVRAKILSQAAAWVAVDPTVEVGIFVRCESGAESDWLGQPHVVSVRSSRAGIVGRLIQRELLSLDVARWRPDVIYLRQSTVSPSVVLLTAALPTVVELNTLDLAELRLRSRLRYFYAAATRALVLRTARGLVGVAAEITAHPSVRRFGRRTAVVPNAIDLAANPPLPPPNNAAPRLVFLGAPRLPWHGLDKIDQLARIFPEWTFDVIGPSPEELPDHAQNVHVHGLMDPADYLPILTQADIGIGPLALHRKDMTEASPLKVAEYLARGIPAIIGYTDTRFPFGAAFLLAVPNAEGNIESSIDRVGDFVRSWMGRRVDPRALASIDARQVERRRLEFILMSLGRGQSRWTR